MACVREWGTGDIQGHEVLLLYITLSAAILEGELSIWEGRKLQICL